MSTMRLVTAWSMLILLAWATWSSGRIGYSRTLADAGLQSDSLALADRAVRMSPADPEVHYLRASVLKDLGQQAKALKELESAVSLRPRYYFLQLRLAHARDRMGDRQGALDAYQNAVRRAPYYAQPHWYLAHFLLRTGQYNEAFAELRRATASDPSLRDDLIAFARGTFNDDPAAIGKALPPEAATERLALAGFFVEQGKTAEAITLFHGTRGASPEEIRDFLEKLLAVKRYTEAFEVWSGAHNAEGGPESMINGGFESPIATDDPGFGWQVAANVNATHVYLDPIEPHAGARSMLLEFKGDADPSTRLVSQIILVKPHTRYQLSFSARSKELVTGGLPTVVVTEAADDSHRLGQVTMTPGTSVWSDHTIEFVTGEATSAVMVSVQRERCERSPCPIYGNIWLDDFSLRRL